MSATPTENTGLTQGSPEWHRFRSTRFGASELAAAMGLSPYLSRTELLRIKKTGVAQAVSEHQQAIFDHGHAVETLARPIVEEIIGEDLYQKTFTKDRLIASCDGITLTDEVIFEHKQWNEKLAESVRNRQLPEHHNPQCQQMLYLTGAEKCLFVVSDGTKERFESLWVERDEAFIERIPQIWAQFEQDLDAYEVLDPKPTLQGTAPDQLPALFVELTGAVTATNLDDFRDKALGLIDGINTQLETDADFADAEATAKWCKEIERRLEAAKDQALSKTASIDALFRAIDAIHAQSKQKRLALDKQVKERKRSIKEGQVDEAVQAFQDHLYSNACDAVEFAPRAFNDPRPVLAESITGLKTITSAENALATTLANLKLEADQTAKEVLRKRDWFNQNAADYKALFADLATIAIKPFDDFVLLVESRIRQQREAEARRVEEAKQAEANTVKAQQERVEEAQSATLTVGDISNLLTPLFITGTGISELGIEADSKGAAKLYTREQFRDLCLAIQRHVDRAYSDFLENLGGAT